MPRRPSPLPQAAKDIEGIIRSTVAQGMTGRAALDTLRSRGLRIRTQSFYTARRRFQAEFAAGRAITARRGNQTIRSSSLPPAYYDTRQQNQAVVQMNYTDVETGDEFSINRTVSWTGANTKAGIDAAVDDMRSRYPLTGEPIDNGSFDGYEVVSAVQRSGS